MTENDKSSKPARKLVIHQEPTVIPAPPEEKPKAKEKPETEAK